MCLYRLYNYVTIKYHKLHVLVDKSIDILTIYNICSYDIHYYYRVSFLYNDVCIFKKNSCLQSRQQEWDICSRKWRSD